MSKTKCFQLFTVCLNYEYRKYIFILLSLLINHNLFSQSAGIQCNSGFGKPIVVFDAPNALVNYQSAMNNDNRLGIWVGDYDKISVGLLLGAFNVKANYVNPDGLASEFNHSSLLIDIPIRYALKNAFIKSASVGPCMNILMSSNQSINGKPNYSQDVFKSINWAIGCEISFKGYESNNFNLSPYMSYKHMINSADAIDDNESLKLHSFSLGMRCDIFLPL